MLSLVADTDVSVPVPFQVSGTGAHFLAYDQRDHKVYWDETDPPAIRRADIESSDTPEVFIGTDIRCVSGLAVDPFSHNLYWSDCVLDKIEVVSISSKTPLGFERGQRVRKVLVSGGIHHPQSLALDLRGGFMYWVDLDTGGPRIERAKLNGSERVVLYSNLNPSPTYLAIDPAANGSIYWTDSKQRWSDQFRVHRCQRIGRI
jgi:hypothetical protein